MKKIGLFFKKIGSFFQKIWLIISEFVRCKLSVWIGIGLEVICKYTGITWLYNKYQKHVSNKGKKAVAGYLFILPWLILAMYGKTRSKIYLRCILL